MKSNNRYIHNAHMKSHHLLMMNHLLTIQSASNNRLDYDREGAWGGRHTSKLFTLNSNIPMLNLHGFILRKAITTIR